MKTKILKTFSENTTFPILNHVYIEKNRITLNQLDCRLTIESNEIAPNFDGHYFLEIKNLTKFKEVEFLNGYARSGKVKINPVNQFELSELPIFKDEEKPFFMVEDPKSFLKKINLIKHARSKDETRYNIQGFFYNGLDLVATDGHRMATATEISTEYNKDTKEKRVSIHEFIERIDGFNLERLDIVIHEKFTRVTWYDAGCHYVLDLMNNDVQYPDWKRLFNNDNKTSIHLHNGHLKSIREDMSLIKKHIKTSGVREPSFKLSINGTMKIHANDKENGFEYENEYQYSCTPEFNQFFNSRYFREALNDENITLKFSNIHHNGALEIYSRDKIELIMPTRA